MKDTAVISDEVREITDTQECREELPPDAFDEDLTHTPSLPPS